MNNKHKIFWLDIKFKSRFIENKFLITKMKHDKMTILFILPIAVLLVIVVTFFDKYFTDTIFDLVGLISLHVIMSIVCVSYYFLFKKTNNIRKFKTRLYSFYLILILLIILTQFFYKPYLDAFIPFFIIFVLVYTNFVLMGIRLLLLLISLFFTLSYFCLYYFSQLYVEQYICILLVYAVTILVSTILALRNQLSIRDEFALRQSLNLKARQLMQLSQRDTLTNAHNRRALEMKYAKYQESAQNLSGTLNGLYAIMFDLDKFKHINDHYGHKVGDEVIIAMSRALESMLRPYDDLYRLGGDEFLIILSDIDETNAKTVCEKIVRTIANEAMSFRQEKLHVTASLGMTKIEPHEKLGQALARADKALYKSKEKNGNCFTVCIN